MTVIIDNGDGFSYNLYQALAKFDCDVKIIKGDQNALDKIKALNPSHIVISSGPGKPEDAEIIKEILKELGGRIPILGIGLGHQTIGVAFGGKVERASTIMHGKSSRITIDDGCPIFKNLPSRINAGMYHSLVIKSLPEDLKAAAFDEEGQIMAIRHKDYKIFGLQFCPDSILTDCGEAILQNFLEV